MASKSSHAMSLCHHLFVVVLTLACYFCATPYYTRMVDLLMYQIKNEKNCLIFIYIYLFTQKYRIYYYILSSIIRDRSNNVDTLCTVVGQEGRVKVSSYK